MALFDYGNTRLRARISSLLPIETLESFTNSSSIDSLISSLTKTPYKESIETALTYSHGYGCVTQAMRMELEQIIDDLNEFYQEDAKEKVNHIFLREDLESLKAIVRGLIHEMPLDEIIHSFSPLSSIPRPILTQLAKSKSLDEAISKAVIYDIPVSERLLEWRSKHEEQSSSEIELVIEKWYFHRIEELLADSSQDSELLREFYSIEADIINLNTLLRVVEAEDGRSNLKENFEEYLIDYGFLPNSGLVRLAKEKSVDNVIRNLFSTRYGKNLRKGLDCYRDTKRLSEFENQMHVYMLNWQAKLPKLFPLGIGVPLGYVAKKRNEIRNIRWIAKSIDSGFEPSYIQENLQRIE